MQDDRTQAQAREPNCVCKVCGKAFYTKPSLIRLRNGGQHCSRACHGITLSAQRRGRYFRPDSTSVTTGRNRARQLYDLGPCAVCGADGVDRHHKNGSTLDNRPENVQVLCRRCHMEVDGRLAAFRKAQRRKLTPEQMVEIWEACQRPYFRGMYMRLAEAYGVSDSTIRSIRDGGRVVIAQKRECL